MITFTRIRAAATSLLIGSALALSSLHLAQVASPQVSRAAAGVDLPALDGYWRNVDTQTRNITKVHIYYSTQHQALQVAVWGKCHPTDCCWGTVNAAPFSFLQATATYHFSFANKYLAMWSRDSQLKVKTHIDFIDGSGRQSYDTYDVFNRVS